MHAFLSVMKGCLNTEYCAVCAKHKGIIKICSQLLLKGKTFFFSPCLNIVLQPALLPGGSGLNVNAVMRINNRLLIQMHEGVFRITLNLIIIFYSM